MRPTLRALGYRDRLGPQDLRDLLTLLAASFETIVVSATVANTVTETEVYAATIAPNDLYAERILEIRLLGYFSTALAAHQATIRCKVGGTTVVTLTTPTAAAYTNESLSIRFTFSVRSVGASGTIFGYGECFAANVGRSVANTGTTTINTTASTNISVTVEWSVANAGTTLTIAQGTTRD